MFGRSVVLLAVVLSVILSSVPTIAQSWEFNTDGNTEGWYAAHSVTGLRTFGGCLIGDVSGADPYIISQRYPEIDANVNRYIHIRMKTTTGSGAEFFWGTAAEPYHKAGREVWFNLVSDGQFHEYIVDMFTNPEWTGMVNTLRLDPTDASTGRFEVDYIRPLSTAPAIVNVSVPAVADRFVEVGEQFTVTVTIRNEGFAEASNIRANLSAAGQTVLSAQPQTISALAPSAETTLTWQVRADSERAGNLSVSVTSENPGGTTTKSSILLVTAPLALLPAAAPLQSQAWTDASGNAVIENDRIRMAFYKSSFGYGIAQLYVRNGVNWDLVAASAPLSRVSYLADGDVPVDLAITPISVTPSKTGTTAQLAFSFDCPDPEGGRWRGSIVYELGDADDTIKANYSLNCSAFRKLTAWVGPSLCPGNRSFGSSKSQALFPGLEWLVGDEKSSNTLEFKPPLNLRLVLHPYKVTVPLMAVSGNGSVTALLWNALRKWSGNDAYPSAKFSSPNWYEGQNNHLMELFVPSIPKWVSENSVTAGNAFWLLAGMQLTMECCYFARSGGEVLDAVQKWYSIYGTPALPGGASLIESGMLTARAGFMTTIWDPVRKGWPHAVTWTADPYPEYIQDLFADSLSETDPVEKAALRARVDEALQKALTLWGAQGLGYGAGSHLPGYRLPYFAGHLRELASQMNADINGIRASQQADGGWFVPTNPNYPELTTPGTKELGSCAQNAYQLLRFARLSGNSAARTAGLKALAYMNTFTVPRAAQVWEVPQHAPDILAAGWAVGAYLEGYLLTGDSNHLAKARYWAMAGLPFIYTWKAYDRSIMDYATIPVLGATLFQLSWLGLPVQWCGMVYAYYIHHLSEYDSSMPWHTIAEGITRSCVQQMNVSPYLGTYPDSINLLYSNTPNPVYINPDNIYKCANRILGRWGEIDVRKFVGPSKTAYVSTAAKSLIGCFSSGGNQLNLKFNYPAGETCHILIYGTGQPAALYKDGRRLLKVSDVDVAAEGWSYNSTLGCLVIKGNQGSNTGIIEMVFSGGYIPVNQVTSPAQAKALSNGAVVVFNGIVTSGADDLDIGIYVESDDRTSGIKVIPAIPPLAPIKAGDKVEVIGCLSIASGERYVAGADVRTAP